MFVFPECFKATAVILEPLAAPDWTTCEPSACSLINHCPKGPASDYLTQYGKQTSLLMLSHANHSVCIPAKLILAHAFLLTIIKHRFYFKNIYLICWRDETMSHPFNIVLKGWDILNKEYRLPLWIETNWILVGWAGKWLELTSENDWANFQWKTCRGSDFEFSDNCSYHFDIWYNRISIWAHFEIKCFEHNCLQMHLKGYFKIQGFSFRLHWLF